MIFLNNFQHLTVAAPSTEQLGAIRALPYGFADLGRATTVLVVASVELDRLREADQHPNLCAENRSVVYF